MTITMTGYARKFEVPRYIRDRLEPSSILASGRVTVWDLFNHEIPDYATGWADRIIKSVLTAAGAKSSEALDCGTCEDTGFYGVTDTWDDDILRSLVKRDGIGYQLLTASGQWIPHDPSSAPLEMLDLDLAQDLADTILAGASGLARRYYWPLAFLDPEPMTAATPVDMQQIPTTGEDDSGWFNYAVVDPLDTGAVLSLIRLRPGPDLESFTGGAWEPDAKILANLMGVNPPPLVELDAAQLESVKNQIAGGGGNDAAAKTVAAAGLSTKERARAADKGFAMDDGSFPIRNRNELAKAVKAFGRSANKAAAKRHIIKRARKLNAIGSLPESWGVKASGALVADAPLTVSPNPKAEKLRRYWSKGGKGGLKIRWGAPGDWKRCFKQLSKYMGERAKGYCANLHKRNTGVWTGSKLNASLVSSIEIGNGQGGLSWTPRDTMSTSSGTTASGSRTSEGVIRMAVKDGIYRERDTASVFRALLAGAFPVAPPDEWFEDPQFTKLTSLSVGDDGRVSGHLADFNMSHIGLPGSIRPPRSRSGYAYYQTGSLRTASGATVRVGQLTLTGGHAPLEASAAEAIKHYDDTNSAVADVHVGEDKFGIWFAGALRPDVTPQQVRAFMASALSGDWRPINGSLEMVACCSVNVPGFPIAEARVASGAVMALVAAGSRGVALVQAGLLADAAVLERLETVEEVLNGIEIATADTVVEEPEEGEEGEVEEEPATDDTTDEEYELTSDDLAAIEGLVEAAPVVDTTGILDKVARARQAVQERRAAVTDPDPVANEAAQRRQALRDRVHRSSNRV